MGATIITTVTTALSSFLSAAGSAIVDVFNTVVVTENGGLTNFATWALVFLGVSLAIGVITAILRKVG